MLKPFLVLVLFSLSEYSFAWTIELTEAELQERIDKRVPIEKKKLIFTVLVSKIDVVLEENSDRIGMVADIEIRSPHFTSGKGRAEMDGRLEYEKEDGQFYLREPVVKKVEFENVPGRHHGLLKKIFQRAVSRRMARTPIYRLDTDRTRHQIAKTLLKSVRVNNGKLVLEMGLL